MPFNIPESVDIPDGSYPATLERVESLEGNFGPYRKWHWLVQTAGDKIESMSSLTSGNTGPRSKSFEFLTALLGRTPQAGEQIEDPTGTKVILTIDRNDKGFPTVKAVTPYTDPQQVIPGVPR